MAKYAGPNDEYICTGSDSGHAWIYDKQTGAVAGKSIYLNYELYSVLFVILLIFEYIQPFFVQIIVHVMEFCPTLLCLISLPMALTLQ